MEYNKLIAGMHTGDDVEGFYVLKDAFLKTTAAGKPFLSGVLADRSGTIDLKVWDYSGPIGANPAAPGLAPTSSLRYANGRNVQDKP